MRYLGGAGVKSRVRSKVVRDFLLFVLELGRERRHNPSPRDSRASTAELTNSHQGACRVSFVDKTLTCVDCKAPFTFTAGEQEFHSSKGFTNEPRRCSNCRQNRRSSRDGGGGGGFGGGGGRDRGERSFGGDRGGFGGGGGGGFGAPRREMFDAVCAECGKETQVPFQPSGSRPVYCRDCFSSHSPPRRGGGGGGGFGDRGGRGDSRSSRY